jgi:hypothetical protein
VPTRSGYTHREAAALLGLTPDAVAKRVRAGTLAESPQGADGIQRVDQDQVERERRDVLTRLTALDARPEHLGKDLHERGFAHISEQDLGDLPSRLREIDAHRTELLARVAELRVIGAGLQTMVEASWPIIRQRLVPDSPND